MRYYWIVLNFLAAQACAQAAEPLPTQPNSRQGAGQVTTQGTGQVIVSGTVADEASKARALNRLRELYGNDKVVDQISVGAVVVPANWNDYVEKLIGPNLKLVSHGELKIDGTTVNLRGDVANEAQRQQIVSEVATRLNPTYQVVNGLRVVASGQGVLDTTLGNRIVEFESGQTALTPTGQRILDEMASVMQTMKNSKFEIVGHTDDVGLRTSNVALSQARAEAVKQYLSNKGIDGALLTASGQGPDKPLASNDTATGRARNRRIEFRLQQ